MVQLNDSWCESQASGDALPVLNKNKGKNKKTARAGIRRKDQAIREFQAVGEELDQNLDSVVSRQDFVQINQYNEKNEDLYRKYHHQDEGNAEVGYDMAVFHQDTNNTTKMIGALQKITLKNYNTKKYKFPWATVAKGIRHIGGVSLSTPMKSVKRYTWMVSAKRLALITDPSFCGYNNTHYLHTIQPSEIAKKKKPDVKKEKKEKISRINEEARQLAEMLMQNQAEETAFAQDEYAQNEGQVSTKVLESIKEKFRTYCEDNGLMEVEYYRAIIDGRSFAKTIENMFYVSFLIKDKVLGISMDRHLIPVLFDLGHREKQAKRRRLNGDTTVGIADKEDMSTLEPNQGVMMMTHEHWEELVKILELKDEPSIICQN